MNTACPAAHRCATMRRPNRMRKVGRFLEIGEIVAGLRPGRESDDERIMFWHKGFAISDIVLGHLAYEKARERGVGTPLTFHASPRDE